MYKRKNKPDLMFLLTIFVCLGVTVSVAVNASDNPQQGWGMTLSTEKDCQQSLVEWSGCSGWHVLDQASEHGSQRAALTFSHRQQPGLGVTWYYAQFPRVKSLYINDLSDTPAISVHHREAGNRGQFGVSLRQQYRHFGFSVGIESEQALPLHEEAVVYFGISNRW